MSEAVVLRIRKKQAFWSTVGLLSILLNGLALVALVRRAVDLGSLAKPLDLMMVAYSAATQMALGWAEPYLQTLMVAVNDYLGSHLVLYPSWKDALVWFGTCGAAYARASIMFDVSKFGFGSISVQIRWVAVVLLATLALGMLPPHSDSAIVQIATVVVSQGAFSLNFLDWHDFFQAVLFASYVVCLAPLLAWLIGESSWIVEGICFFIIALWGLGVGSREVFRGLAANKDRDALRHVGVVMTGGLAIAACFFGVDSTLKFLTLYSANSPAL